MNTPRSTRSTLASAALAASLMVLPAPPSGFAQGAASDLSGSKEKQPNIIFIMFDDLDYFDLGVYGNPNILTPAIDQAANEGLRLTNYYATPLCPPTRNSLMTGDYPMRHGLKRLPPFSTKGIAEDMVLPSVLQVYGYTTAHVGKWHLGHEHDEYLPHNKGYDTSLVGKGYIGTPDPNYAMAELLLDGEPVPPTQHVTAALTDFTLEFIEQNKSDPFFINLWYFTPHKPLECPTDFLPVCGSSSDTAVIYKAMVENADIQVGRIFTKLHELGLDKNTLVVITSDNGGTSDTQLQLPPGVMKGKKTQVFERGIKVPFIAWAPGLVQPGTVNDSVVASIDMVPTFEQLARSEDIFIADFFFDGISALDILTAETPQTKPRDGFLFWELNHKDNDDYPSPSTWYQNFAVREGDWKLVMEQNSQSNWPKPKLFDLPTNPAEKNLRDKSDEFPIQVDRMMAAYWDWRRDTSSVGYSVTDAEGTVTHSGGPIGKTFQFTGGGGHADLKDREIFDFGEGEFSISMGVRFDEVGTSPVLVEKTDSWVLSLDDQDRLRFRVVGVPEIPGDPVPIAIINSDAPLVTGNHYDIALTIHGFRSDDSTIRMYINGIEQSGTNDSLPRVAISPDAIRVGNNHETPPNRPFIGEIEDLTFYVSALTLNEVSALE